MVLIILFLIATFVYLVALAICLLYHYKQNKGKFETVGDIIRDAKVWYFAPVLNEYLAVMFILYMIFQWLSESFDEISINND